MISYISTELSLLNGADCEIEYILHDSETCDFTFSEVAKRLEILSVYMWGASGYFLSIGGISDIEYTSIVVDTINAIIN